LAKPRVRGIRRSKDEELEAEPAAEWTVLSLPIVPGKAHDYRCNKCGRLIFRANLQTGSKVESRCPRCSHFLVWDSSVKSTVTLS